MDESLLQDFEEIFTGERSHETFLQFYNHSIKTFKLSPEYLGVLNDMKHLISKNKSELEQKIKKIFFEMKELHNNDEGNETRKDNVDTMWSGMEFKKNVNHIKNLPLDNLSSDEASLNFIFLLGKILTAEYETNFKGEQLLSKNIALVQFLINIRMEMNFKKLAASSQFQNIPIDVVYKIRDLGADHFLFDSTKTLENNQLQDLMHKIISSRAGNKGQAKRQNDYESAVDHAEYLWGKEKRAHTINEMVKHLLNKKQYEHLFDRTLREKIKKTAQKYNKLPPRGRPPKKK